MLGRVKEDSGWAAGDLGKVRDIFRRTIDEGLWSSVINNVLRQEKDNALATRLSHSKKKEKLANRQESALGQTHSKAEKVQDEIKLPGWIDELNIQFVSNSMKTTF